MFSKLHDRLGTAGLAVAVVALIVALTGTAFAAATALNGKQKKEVEKIAKKYAGKNGKNGAAGATGPAGAAGSAGKDGAAGAAGKDGVSVTTSAASGAECPTGGVKLAAASGNSKVCNGEEGLQGPAGNPWTAGGVLPAGATETGVWGDNFNEEGVASITFAIPVKEKIEGLKVIKVAEGAPAGSVAECDNGTGEGGSAANPEADEGFLCVFVGAFEGTGTAILATVNPTTFGAGASKAGASILLGATAKGFAVGTFAVTGF